MQLCSLSVAYACPYHNPTTTIGHSLKLTLKLTFNSLATALVDIPAVSMPRARSLKTRNICGIVLCDKTAHFRMAFYCLQHKVHLCNERAV